VIPIRFVEGSGAFFDRAGTALVTGNELFLYSGEEYARHVYLRWERGEGSKE